MKKIRLVILLFIFALSFSGVKAAYYYSKASGASALQTKTNWGTNTDGTGTNPANFTTAGDTFEVRNMTSGTIGAAWTVSGTNTRVVVGDGSSSTELVVPSGFRLNASVIVRNAGTLTINFLTVPTLDVLDVGSTVKYMGAGAQAVVTKTFYNLEIGGSGTKATGGDITVNGSLTINSGAIFDFNSTSEELLGTLSGGLFGTGTLRTTSTHATAPIPASISWPFAVEFYGTTQKIPTGSTFTDLSFTGASGVKTALGDISISNSLDVETGNTLAMTTFKLSGAFTSIFGSGTITTTNTSANPIPSGLTWSQSVTYAGSAVAQTVVSGTYANLSITTGSDVNTASGNITIDNSGVLTVTTSTFDLSTFQLIFGAGASAAGTGTIRTQNTSSTPLPAGETWTQTILYNSASAQTVVDGQYVALTLTGGNRTFSTAGNISVSGALILGSGTITTTGSTLELNGASTQTITVPSGGATFNNIAVTAGTTKTISGGSITMKGSLDIEAGSILAMGANTMSSTTLTTSGTGTLTTTNTGSTPLPVNVTWSFLVSYSGNGNQTVVRGTYNGGLTLGGTSGTKTMNGDVSVGTSTDGILTINTSRILSIGAGNTLTINGTIDGAQTGTITGSATSNIVIGDNGAVAGTILMTQTSNTTKSVQNFTLARNAGTDAIIIGNPMRIITLLTVTDGELNANGNLTLVSTAAGTSAQVASVTGTGNITGDVSVERYIPGRAIASNVRWRFLASPVNTSNTISNSWQQQIYITGSGTGGTLCPSLTAHTNGFDPTSSNAPSFYNWDKSVQNWVALSNTNATDLVTGQGCRVFIRGTRAQGCTLFSASPPTPLDVNLIATGTLAVGDQVLACASAASGFELIGNPYQATVDWDLVSKTNIAGTIYGFKPDGTTNGAYGTYNGGIGTNGMTKYISPGTAIWVQTDGSGNGSITISESDKNVSQSGFAYFKTGSVLSSLRTKLFMDTLSEYVDEVVLAVTENTSWTYDMEEDAKKFGFASNQLALFTPSASDRYAICRVPGFDSVNNRINIDAKTVSNHSYTFKFEELNTFDPNMMITLVDNFAGTTQNLTSNDVYAFTTSNDPLSTDAGRFYITIDNNNSSLPVTLTSFTAKKDVNATKLSWLTSSEVNSDKFVVERSKDISTGFETIGTVKAAGSSSQVVSYNWVDKTPALGMMNYYRLNQFDKNGAHTYSQVVAVDYSTKAASALQVNYYPVPVSTVLTLEISNNKVPIDNGQGVAIFDVFGKKVATLNMINASNGTYTVDMSSLSDGVYILQMSVDGESIKHKFVKN